MVRKRECLIQGASLRHYGNSKNKMASERRVALKELINSSKNKNPFSLKNKQFSRVYNSFLFIDQKLVKNCY